MINLTDEQIETIYEKHAIEFVADDEIQFDYLGLLQVDGFVEDLLKSLTLPQIKQIAKEEHNASVVQWVEFDADDESSFPEHDPEVIIECDTGKIFSLDFDIERAINHPESYKYVKRWCNLPQPKEK
ncbi:hypothetical protein THIOSC15_2720016 [uncultured Thiomicrorhabdus sp.]